MKCPSCRVENLEDSKFCRKCATALPGGAASFTRTLVQGPAEFTSGTVIAGRYKINKILGRGGMGIVYLADDTRLKRPVALKFLPPGLALDEDIKRRFIIEAQAAAALSHPNICTIYEVDDQAEKAFISMEYIEGENLREKASKDPLAFDHVLAIALQICAGLDEAHKKGIVHRDIKSANIMLTAKGQAKIMDFGLAKVAGTAMVTKEGSTMGTVAYMSPEQAKGETVDARTDIWSLGVVLYELASGKLPFRGDLESAIIHNIIHEEPKPLKAIVPKVPEEFERIIRRALKKKVEDRYGSTAEMLADLRKLHAALEKEKTGVFNLRSFLRIIRKPLVAIPFALVLIALGFVIYSILKRQAKINLVRDELLPKIESLIEAGQGSYVEAYKLAVEGEKYLPNDPKLTEFFSKIAVTISIQTEPPGAKISQKEYQAAESEWTYLGVSPIEKIRLPVGFFRWKAEKEGYETVYAASPTFDLDYANPRYVVPLNLNRKLDERGKIPQGMVRIKGEKVERIGEIGDFLIDQYEVTNKQFKEFVDRGGYQEKKYWKEKFLKDGNELTWEEAMKMFVDQTGRPGPATWLAGDYPGGQDDYPVSGISWYEAAAFAEFMGKSLPTLHHWGIAAEGGISQILLSRGFNSLLAPLSNFMGKGPARVGSYPGMTGYGAYDMAGNVREWCWNEAITGRITRGGAWNDAPYMFEDSSQALPLDRSPRNGFRCVYYLEPNKIPASAFEAAKIVELPDFYKAKPVPDSVFQTYKEQFSYDKTGLDARVEWKKESSEDWTEEKVTFKAAYENERMIAHLFLPRKGSPPYQTVIFYPGGGVVAQPSSENLDKYWEFEDRLSLIVKNGRAVLFPIYEGTFERSDVAYAPVGANPNSYLRTELLIKIIKDFRRCIDYLETRSDIDSQKLAYFGWSSGGSRGAMIPAVEDRLKASILAVGGLSGAGRLEVRDINYVGRVRVPTLMLNGRYDLDVPYETSGKPFFDLLGTPKEDKRQKLYETDHYVPINEIIKETLAWLDKYLGPVNK